MNGRIRLFDEYDQYIHDGKLYLANEISAYGDKAPFPIPALHHFSHHVDSFIRLRVLHLIGWLRKSADDVDDPLVVDVIHRLCMDESAAVRNLARKHPACPPEARALGALDTP